MKQRLLDILEQLETPSPSGFVILTETQAQVCARLIHALLEFNEDANTATDGFDQHPVA